MPSGVWRYIAQHPFTGAILDLEVPLKGVSLTRRLSGPWAMSATLSPDVQQMLTPAGDRVLDEWRVQVWAELDGVIRGGGILTNGQIVGASWSLTFDGHLRYPYGIPYDGAYSRIEVDALDAFREVWRHVQSYPDGDLGLVVDDTTTGGTMLLGTPVVPAFWEVSFSAEGTPKESQVWVREDTAPAGQIDRPVQAHIDTITTRLSAAITLGATTLNVTTDAFQGLPTPFTIKVGSELIRVRDLSPNGRVMSNLVRGFQTNDGSVVASDRAPHADNSPVEYDGIGKVDDQLFLKPTNPWTGAPRGFDTDFGAVAVPFTIKVGSELIRVRSKTGRVLSNLVRGWDVVDRESKPGQIDAHADGAAITYTGTPRRLVERVAAEPYTLAWWDAVDCGDELETLAKETPVEYVETHEWNADRSAIEHRLRLGYPRLGRRRTDIGFVEGENLAVVPQIDRAGDDFAQYVIGLGAGEGRKRRRTATIGSPDGRLRRPWLLERPDVTSVDRLNRLATQERAARSTMSAIPDVLLKDHPNAPLGSWELGDEVLVTLRYGWANESVWCRIVEETVTPAAAGQVVALKLTRADGV